MRILHFLATGFSLVSTLALTAQNPIALEIAERRQMYGDPVVYAPCTPTVHNEAAHDAIIPVRNYFLLQEEVAAEMISTHAPFAELKIPYGDVTIVAEVYPVQIFADGFSVQSPDGAITYDTQTRSIQYRGIIKDDPNSLVAISIFTDHMEGVIAGENTGNLVCAPLKSGNVHVLYYDRNLSIANPINCSTPDPVAFHYPEVTDAKMEALDPCVKVYIEADFEMYEDEGGATETADYIVSFFNVVSTLYANELINTVISEIFVWTTADPYPTTSSFDALDEFLTVRTEFNGDIAHLVTYDDENLGGVAWVDILCYEPLSYAYSNIYSYFSDFPTYSWTVEVFTHEMGHNLGSPHTQNCEWPGGAIDNCWTTEGGCAPGPEPVDGGTIMSYCHLTGYGINFANGFGPLPGDLIRDKVDAAACLGACDLPPLNDWPCAAIEIPVNGECLFTDATNIGAINSVVPVVTCDGDSEGDVWFTLTVGPDGYVIIETDDSDDIDDMGMKIYHGTCTDLSNIPGGCVADGSTYGELMPGYVVEAPPGTTLFIRVWDVNNDDFGDFSICAYTECVPSVAPTAILADDMIICEGESATLSLDGGALGSLAQWNWYADACGTTLLSTAETITVTPTTTTTYFVQATGECGSTECIAVTIEVAPYPEVPEISMSDCILSTELIDGATYTWYYDGTEIVGETSNTLPFTTEGAYSVMVTTFGDCSATSAAFEALCDQNAISAYDGFQVSLHPNPAHENYQIIIGGYTGDISISVHTITGQLISIQKLFVDMETKINMEAAQTAGVYLVQLQTKGMSKDVLLIVE